MSVFLREIAGTVRRHALALALVVSAGVLLSGGAALSGSALWWVPALLAAGLALGFVLRADAPVGFESAAVLGLLVGVGVAGERSSCI